MRITTKPVILTSLFLWLLASVIVFFTILQGAHTFELLPNWVSLKYDGTYCCKLMGSYQFNDERQPLYKNTLRLGAWHGFHEIIWNKPLNWTDLKFDYELEENSYLWIFFAQKSDKRFAIRLSANANFPGGLFEIDRDGKFLRRTHYPSLTIPAGKYKFHSKLENHMISFFNNESLITTYSIPIPYHQFFSLRNGLHAVSIDNIVAKNGDELLISEDFYPPVTFNKFLVSCLLTAILIGIFVGLIIKIKKKTSLQIISLPTIVFQILLVFFFAFYFMFDYFFWSKIYYAKNSSIENHIESLNLYPIEETRMKIFYVLSGITPRMQFSSKYLDPEIISFHKIDKAPFEREDYQYIDSKGHATQLESLEEFPPKKPQFLNIAFMGSSQTWGEGARTLDERFVSQSIKKLNEKYKIPATAINFAVQGNLSGEQLDIYKKVLEKITPDILVVNLSNNDTDANVFKYNLEKAAEINKSKKIKTLFILEANTVEIPAYHLHRNHAPMREVAQTYQIPVISFFDFVRSNEIYDTGFLWWDTVHLAPHGHNISSDWLSQNLANFINGKMK